jgi:hypothetical protein
MGSAAGDFYGSLGWDSVLSSSSLVSGRHLAYGIARVRGWGGVGWGLGGWGGGRTHCTWARQSALQCRAWRSWALNRFSP